MVSPRNLDRISELAGEDRRGSIPPPWGEDLTAEGPHFLVKIFAKTPEKAKKNSPAPHSYYYYISENGPQAKKLQFLGKIARKNLGGFRGGRTVWD